jgi:transcriptional regulator with XRE-family HTH domain
LEGIPVAETEKPGERQKSLAEEIKSLREKLSLTQAQFATAVGVEQATVSRWEQGLAEPSYENVLALEAFKAGRGAALGYMSKRLRNTTAKMRELNRDLRALPHTAVVFGYLRVDEVVDRATPDERGELQRIESEITPVLHTLAAVIATGDLYGLIEQNWCLYFNDERKPLRDAAAVLSFVGLADGRVMLKRPIAASRRGTAHLLSARTAPLLNMEVEWVAPVLWIRAGVNGPLPPASVVPPPPPLSDRIDEAANVDKLE